MDYGIEEILKLAFWKFPLEYKLQVLSLFISTLLVEILMEKEKRKYLRMIAILLLTPAIFIGILLIELIVRFFSSLILIGTSPPEMLNYMTGVFVISIWFFIGVAIFAVISERRRFPTRKELKAKVGKLFSHFRSNAWVQLVGSLFLGFLFVKLIVLLLSSKLSFFNTYTPDTFAGALFSCVLLAVFLYGSDKKVKSKWIGVSLILGMLAGMVTTEIVRIEEVPISVDFSCSAYRGESFISCEKRVELTTKNYVNVSYLISTRKWIAFERPISLTSCWYKEGDSPLLKEARIYEHKKDEKTTIKYCIFNFTRIPKKFEYWADYTVQMRTNGEKESDLSSIRLRTGDEVKIGKWLTIKYQANEKINESWSKYCFYSQIPIRWTIEWWPTNLGSTNYTVLCINDENCWVSCDDQNNYCKIGTKGLLTKDFCMYVYFE